MMQKWLRLFGTAGVVLALDQTTKLTVINDLRLGETRQVIPALSPFFQVTRSHNTGSAFGFLPQAGDLFLIIAIVVVAAMVIFYPRVPPQARLVQFATGLICGGALGNALDRLAHGYVVDFIHYQIPGLISNVSNLADHALVLGVIVLFVDSWWSERHKNRRAADVPEDAAPPA